MERQLWVKRVGDRIKTSEAKIDEAMQSVMALMQEVQSAQSDMSVSPTVTDTAMVKLMAGLSALQDARSSVVGGHRRLDKIAGDLNLRTVGLGFDFKVPTSEGEIGAADEVLERAVG